MANILIATMGFSGHISAALPLARKLVERGNQVRWYTTRKFQQKIEATGAVFAPMNAGHDFDDFHLDQAFPEQAALKGLASMKGFIRQVFVDTANGYAEDLEMIVRDFQADVLVVDHVSAAAVPVH